MDLGNRDSPTDVCPQGCYLYPHTIKKNRQNNKNKLVIKLSAGRSSKHEQFSLLQKLNVFKFLQTRKKHQNFRTSEFMPEG